MTKKILIISDPNIPVFRDRLHRQIEKYNALDKRMRKEEKTMLNEDNIMGIIQDHEKRIDELKRAIDGTSSQIVKDVLKKELSYLNDNKYRYEMQAKSWGLM